jgi:glycosyltransferase involved in cell wall biosynthesis
MLSSTSDRRARVAVVLSGWPRLSETFALHELEALRDTGMLAGAFATKPGDGGRCQPGVDGLDVTVLAPGCDAEQGEAVAAALAGRGATGVHGYFAHRPAAVAVHAAALLDVPSGFSAHALDVRKVAPGELAERAAGAAVVVACNTDVAASLRTAGAVATVVGHGVDISRFRPAYPDAPPTGRLLAVGRLVEKKGFDVLLAAIACTETRWCLDLVGDGPERARLEALIDDLGIGHRVRWFGRLTHDVLPCMFAGADAVVVPSRVDRSNDRDGLPNVVLEAMASGRPVVASDVAAIGTAVRDGDTGLLVPPDDAGRLAVALDRLAMDGALRRRLGRRARAAAVAEHDLAGCGRRFVDVMEQAYG